MRLRLEQEALQQLQQVPTLMYALQDGVQHHRQCMGASRHGVPGTVHLKEKIRPADGSKGCHIRHGMHKQGRQSMALSSRVRLASILSRRP